MGGGAEDNTYVRDQNALADPMYTIGTITVGQLRDLLADLPDDAVVTVATDRAGEGGCAPLADVEACWYLPSLGEYAPIGRDADGNIHEPRPGDVYAVLMQPAG